MIEKRYTGKKARNSFIAMVLITILLSSYSFVFADGEDPAIPTKGSAISSSRSDFISKSEIDEGILVAEKYPSSLQLSGVTIPTDTPPVIIRGRVLIPVRALCEAIGGHVLWDESSETVTITLDQTTCVLTVNSDRATVNGEERKLDVPALIIDSNGDGIGSTMVPVRFVTENLNYTPIWDENTRVVNVVPAFQNNVPSDTIENSHAALPPDQTVSQNLTVEGMPMLDRSLSDRTIVIDAGHGGRDSGSLGSDDGQTVMEKEINLAVALKTNEYLKSAGVTTYLIRNDDTAVGLQERPKRANEQNAYVFLSIHHNSAQSPSVGGTETYYYTKPSESAYGIDSKTLAEAVQRELIKQLNLKDRGIKSEPEYAVLNKTLMPAILVECAFLTNPGELKRMQTEDCQNKAAFAIAKGLVDALNASVT